MAAAAENIQILLGLADVSQCLLWSCCFDFEKFAQETEEEKIHVGKQKLRRRKKSSFVLVSEVGTLIGLEPSITHVTFVRIV